jgi:hypothetical protein
VPQENRYSPPPSPAGQEHREVRSSLKRLISLDEKVVMKLWADRSKIGRRFDTLLRIENWSSGVPVKATCSAKPAEDTQMDQFRFYLILAAIVIGVGITFSLVYPTDNRASSTPAAITSF